jgi:predicted metal-dependent phosphotriesterase family hydrolase
VSALRLCDAHCHLWIEPPPGVDGPRLTDERLALSELRAFGDAGGVAVIDCQPGGCGRDGRVLRRLSEASGVAIAPASGFHLERYYARGDSPYLSPTRCLDRWERELSTGLGEEPAIRARVVKSAWTGAEGVERELMAAAAEAAHRGEAPLIVHTERGGHCEELAELLVATELQPSRVQISHIDKRPDPELHRELARAGFVLGYDAFLHRRYRPDDRTWPLLLGLASEGLWEQITVGLDLVDVSRWSAGGGPGLVSIADEVVPRLRAEGIPERAIAGLVGANALAMLDPARVTG